jgi:hypothetical protein
MPSEIDEWALEIHSYSEIPESFRNVFSDEADTNSPFPFTVFAPIATWGNTKTTPKLISLLTNKILFYEQTLSGTVRIVLRYSNISLVENQIVLLYSWIKLDGISDEKTPVSVTMEYNTVMEELFTDLIHRIRKKVIQADKTGKETEGDKFNFLQPLNFKFMSYGKESLLKGERINQIVYQPEIFKPFLKFFRRSVTRSHLEIFTDQEIILLMDGQDNSKKRIESHGGWWRYIPMKKVTTFENVPLDTDRELIMQKIGVADSELIGVLYHEEIRKIYSPIDFTSKEG